jgi:hypothetical protein
VDHERQLATVGRLAGARQRGDAGAARGVAVDARLDAERDVTVELEQLGVVLRSMRALTPSAMSRLSSISLQHRSTSQ